jgi:hypothetical protein
MMYMGAWVALSLLYAITVSSDCMRDAMVVDPFDLYVQWLYVRGYDGRTSPSVRVLWFFPHNNHSSSLTWAVADPGIS